MMNLKQLKAPLAVFMAFGIAACGSDGKDGSDGSDGVTPPVFATTAETLNLEYLTYGIDEQGVRAATFRLTNEKDQLVKGLGSVRFLHSQLATLEKGGTQRQGFGYVTCSANNEAGACLTDNEDGTYTVFNPTSILDLDTSAKGYEFDSEVPQRFMVRVQSYGGLPVIGSVQDIMPEIDFMLSGEAVTTTRKIVSTDSCLACHTDISYARYDSYDRSPHYANDLNACASCHATGEKDGKGTINERAHRWHFDSYLTNVESTKNCLSCHESENTAELPNASDWLAGNDAKACATCHSGDYAPSHGIDMPMTCGGVCHDVAEIHVAPVEALATARDMFSIEVISVEATPVTSTRGGHDYNTAEIALVLEIRDSAGTPVTEMPDFKALRATLAWDASTNYKMLTMETLVGGKLGRMADHSVNAKLNEMEVVPVGAGQYAFVISGALNPDPTKNDTGLIIPTGTEIAKGAVSIESTIMINKAGELQPSGTDGAIQNRLRSVTSFFDMQGLADTQRRQVVSNELCAACHGDMAYGMHSRRNDLEQQCSTCHNPNIAIWDKTFNATKTAPDDTVLNHLGWSVYVHALHAGDREEQNLEDGAIRDWKYPANIKDCAACHVSGSVKLDDIQKSGMFVTRDAYSEDAEFTLTSPAAATCWSCHSGGGEPLKSHMISNGALFNAPLHGADIEGDIVVQQNNLESCSVCHSEAKLAESHKL
ncbi:hypothetical protein CXF83_21375 [Shewanella sp. Choline-02u-19]|uniref:multiheme c-type cytochrome n=1 Tax=unclassified Shewanella TaxID=196818 RepID=UPI000C346EE5|nr:MULTISPECIES: hypothetical protein [unclassified Shewanella]PKH58776.1 hypothetical protein CXF84_04415 [Shewanella sp. Bg11-22]PKI29078.1 hypothetical protein CXF83_21375 [Shewanella sp. Choline-02u-19]